MAPKRSGTASINPTTALRLFRLTPSASLRDLNGAYRRLVRKYHPDYNPERAAWAHEAMIKINAAYDSALEYLAALRYEEIERHLDDVIEAHDPFTDVFVSIASSVLEGVFIYYLYGLENPFARDHGVPRFRFRLALKKVSSGIDQLQRLGSPNPVDSESLDAFCSFSIAFLQCMRMNRAHDPSAAGEEAAAYRHYRTGSRHLDAAIRKLLFRNEFETSRKLAAPHELSVSHAEFMKVLTEYSTSSWVTEAAIKTYLLDAVQKLQKISERMPQLGIGA
jgi:hypothetical protein